MMKRLLLLLVGVLLGGAVGAAFAQQYKWVDKDGRTQYGDFPPAGVKATPLRAPSGPTAPAAPAAPAAGAKAGAKGGAPLSPAEQEAAFRKRQQEGQKAAEKSAQAERDAAAKQENCMRAQAHLRTIESGQRVSTTDSKGDRRAGAHQPAEDADLAARQRQEAGFLQHVANRRALGYEHPGAGLAPRQRLHHFNLQHGHSARRRGE
jgi:Domain of unknown function (DUF4124)